MTLTSVLSACSGCTEYTTRFTSLDAAGDVETLTGVVDVTTNSNGALVTLTSVLCPDCTEYTTTFISTDSTGGLDTLTGVVDVTRNSNGALVMLTSVLSECSGCTEYTTTFTSSDSTGGLETLTGVVDTIMNSNGDLATVTSVCSGAVASVLQNILESFPSSHTLPSTTGAYVSKVSSNSTLLSDVDLLISSRSVTVSPSRSTSFAHSADTDEPGMYTGTLSVPTFESAKSHVVEGLNVNVDSQTFLRQKTLASTDGAEAPVTASTLTYRLSSSGVAANSGLGQISAAPSATSIAGGTRFKRTTGFAALLSLLTIFLL